MTNFDRVKGLDIDGLATFIAGERLRVANPFFEKVGMSDSQKTVIFCLSKGIIKGWLESEEQEE